MLNPQIILDAAFAYKAAGLKVVLDHPELKYPVGFPEWQTKDFTDEEFIEYILNKGYGIGIRNQEGLDFDNHFKSEAAKVLAEWKNLVSVSNPELVNKLLIERTQHGGFHVAWKCEVVGENQKLASRVPTQDELKNDPKLKSVCIIETRGQGGQFVVSPTPGCNIIQGDWCNLIVITPEERSVLLQCARALDQLPKVTESGNATLSGNNKQGERPGDIYNQKGHDEALDLLKENGWEIVYEKNTAKYLRRPGKETGVSATYGYVAPGVFYIFSSNGDPFESNHAYSPFAIYALLKCNGDYSQAAKELAIKYNLKPLKPDYLEDPKERRTDTSNAEKIKELYGNDIRFDHRRKRWLLWNSQIWKPDTDGEITRMAIRAAKERFHETAEIDDPDKRKKAIGWAMQSENKTKLDAAINIAKNILPIADAGNNWDANPMLLAVPNGVVNLRTGELRDGKQSDRITMSSKIKYDPNAKCPLWEKFNKEIFEDNEELIHYVKKSLGYSITGNIQEQVVFLCYGIGANGKSVLFTIVREILDDYAYSAPALMFQRNPLNTSTNDVAAIESRRMLLSSEILSSTKINELRLKKWSGGDQETARYLYGEFFQFYPVCKIWLFVNHKPVVEDDSFGFWRRIRLIPFNRVFKPSEQDKNLVEKLRQELPGILNWLIEGCLLWQKEGLDPTPDVVREATTSYKQENDTLSEFIADVCTESTDLSVRASDLYKSYKDWTETQKLTGKDVLTNATFGRIMGDKYTKVRGGKGISYRGVGITADIVYQSSVGLGLGTTTQCRVDANSIKTATNDSNQDSLLKNASKSTYPTPDADNLITDPTTTFNGELPDLDSMMEGQQ